MFIFTLMVKWKVKFTYRVGVYLARTWYLDRIHSKYINKLFRVSPIFIFALSTWLIIIIIQKLLYYQQIHSWIVGMGVLPSWFVFEPIFYGRMLGANRAKWVLPFSQYCVLKDDFLTKYRSFIGISTTLGLVRQRHVRFRKCRVPRSTPTCY